MISFILSPRNCHFARGQDLHEEMVNKQSSTCSSPDRDISSLSDLDPERVRIDTSSYTDTLTHPHTDTHSLHNHQTRNSFPRHGVSPKENSSEESSKCRKPNGRFDSATTRVVTKLPPLNTTKTYNSKISDTNPEQTNRLLQQRQKTCSKNTASDNSIKDSEFSDPSINNRIGQQHQQHQHSPQDSNTGVPTLPYSPKQTLHRRISNITVDSGRSSTAGTDDNNECVCEEEIDENDPLASNKQDSVSRRHSIACVDSTGHLNVPVYPEFLTSSDPQSPYFSITTSLHQDANERGLTSSQPASSAPVNVRRAPKIVYSHSEDRLTATSGQQRAIIPSLPYSPYGSPTASPRLRRQPTMETHRISVSDGDGYTQLNQYKLKDEIGKVSHRLVGYLNTYHYHHHHHHRCHHHLYLLQHHHNLYNRYYHHQNPPHPLLLLLLGNIISSSNSISIITSGWCS